MATIEHGNWAFTDPGDDIPDESTINGGNFSQLEPGTEILADKTLIINGGNWVNVEQDAKWTVNGGNWSQVSRCSHLHPRYVSRGLDECDDNCDHVVDTDEIWVDGELVDTAYHYSDAVQ